MRKLWWASMYVGLLLGPASSHGQTPTATPFGDWLLDGEDIGSTRAAGLAHALVAVEDSSSALANPALLAQLPRALEANASVGSRGGPLTNLTGGFRPARGWALGLSLFNRPYDRNGALAFDGASGRLRLHVTRYVPLAFAFQPRTRRKRAFDVAFGGALRVDHVQMQEHQQGPAGDQLLKTAGRARLGASVGTAISLQRPGLRLGAVWRTASQVPLILDADGLAGEAIERIRVRLPSMLSYGLAWQHRVERGRLLVTAQGERLGFGEAPPRAGVLPGSLEDLRSRATWTRHDWRAAAELGIPIGGYSGRGQVLDLRAGLWRRGAFAASALPAGREQATASVWHVGASFAALGWGRWRFDAAHHWGPARSTYLGLSFRFPDSFRADLRAPRKTERRGRERASAQQQGGAAKTAAVTPQEAEEAERTLNVQVVDGRQDLAPEEGDATTFLDSGAAVDGVHTWYPVTGFKETACGTLQHFSDGCVPVFRRGLLAECDLNNDLQLDENDPLRAPLELLRCPDKRPMGFGERHPMCSGVQAGHLHTEITPPPELRARLASLWQQQWAWWRDSVGGRLCVHGPLVLDAAHGFTPEVHPAELMWWRQGRSPYRVWTLLWQQDASTRFDQDDNFALRTQPRAGWQPWAGAGALRDTLRIVVKVAKDTTLALVPAQLRPDVAGGCPSDLHLQAACDKAEWLLAPEGTLDGWTIKDCKHIDTLDNFRILTFTITRPAFGGPDWEEQGYALELRECGAPVPAQELSSSAPVDARPETWKNWPRGESLRVALGRAGVREDVLRVLDELGPGVQGLYFDAMQLRTPRLADNEGSAEREATRRCWVPVCKNCTGNVELAEVCTPAVEATNFKAEVRRPHAPLLLFCQAPVSGKECQQSFWNVAVGLGQAGAGALKDALEAALDKERGASPQQALRMIRRLMPQQAKSSRADVGLDRAFDLAIARVLADKRLEVGELEFLLDGLAAANEAYQRSAR